MKFIVSLPRLAGTLALHAVLAAGVHAQTARTLYWAGGNADIADGTKIPTASAQLWGVWDATTKNWAVDAEGTRYVAWEDGTNTVAVLSPCADTPVAARC